MACSEFPFQMNDSNSVLKRALFVLVFTQFCSNITKQTQEKAKTISERIFHHYRLYNFKQNAHRLALWQLEFSLFVLQNVIVFWTILLRFSSHLRIVNLITRNHWLQRSPEYPFLIFICVSRVTAHWSIRTHPR